MKGKVNMKKRIAMLLAGTMLLGLLSACGDKGTTETKDPTGNENNNRCWISEVLQPRTM